uniref:Uridine 5'-monophosphate synthase n=1 Tax=viral metagenome TaxID=1070528 RepID=A0A6C0CLN8_9ZZZZ
MNIDLLEKLYESGIIIQREPGDEITLKSGEKSRIYFDLRSLIAHPRLLSDVVDEMMVVVVSNSFGLGTQFLGVPTTGVPMATLMADRTSDWNNSQLLARTTAKEYGTKRQIEGLTDEISKNLNTIIVDDVFTSGKSINEIREIYKSVTNIDLDIESRAVVFIDRCMDPGVKRPMSCFNMDHIHRFLQSKQIYQSLPLTKLNYYKRIKKTRLIFSADCRMQQLISVISSIGHLLVGIKLHSDAYEYDMEKIHDLAKKVGFVIIEDRKFCDIGSTVKAQFQKILDVYKPDFITVHSLMGKGTLDGLSELNFQKSVGFLLVSDVSSSGSLIDEAYTSKTIELAKQDPEVVGVISQNSDAFRDSQHKKIVMTPGVDITKKTDGLNQTYRHPDNIKSDYVISGRGILDLVSRYKIDGDRKTFMDNVYKYARY